MTSIFLLWHTEHITQSCFVKHHSAAPFQHQRSHNLNVNVEDVLAFVGCQFDQRIHNFAAQIPLTSLLETGLKIITPLDQ